jgi:ribose transport system substrate-binding protein
MNRWIKRGALAASVIALTALTACEGAVSSSNDDDSDAPASSEAQEALDAAYEGVTGTPPTEPTTPKDGVNLWVVSCGEQIPSCSTPTAGVEEAAKAVGWDVNTCDGQLNPTGWGNCIRQATSAGADVVIPIGIDCVAVEAPMQAAVAKGVTLIGGGASDCTAAGGKSLLATERLQLPDTTIQQYWELNGKLQAQWLIGKTDGKAKVMLLNFTDPIWGPWLTKGFTTELETCDECEIVETLDMANNDFVSNTAAQKFSSALLASPDVNAISVPVGGWMGTGLSQAIQASGRAADLAVSSGFGDASTMDLIRDAGYEFGALGYASQWGSYGSVDEAIRVLNGEEPVVEGDGFQMVDKDNNLPESGDYQGDVDFKAEYLALWGVA